MPTLGYAPRPARRTRQWRWAASFLLSAAAVAAGWHWHREVYERAALKYWQRRAIAELPPDGATAYETEPIRARKLIAGGGYIATARPFVHARDGEEASEDGQVGSTAPAAAYKSKAWTHVPKWTGGMSALMSTRSPAATGADCTAFLGRLTSPGGEERIVWIEAREFVEYGNAEPTRGFVFDLYILTPVKVFGSGGAFAHSMGTTYLGDFQLEEHPRLLYGRTDPHDRARLTIDMVGENRLGWRAWWKLNDGETLTPGSEQLEDRP